MSDPVQIASNLEAYSVSELAFALRRTIEGAFGFVRLRGELSKVTRHGSGHIYLDIKDERASIACVIWKTQAQRLATRPEIGLEVIVTGRVTTYPSRSQYQFIIETMEPAGVGALLAQLERLKARLAAEGLFDASRKRALPSMPAVVGVITSPTGAVIRDILHRIRERWPCRVLVWPSLMQGDTAAAQVIEAIQGFNRLPAGRAPRPDVIIVARGGGSIEDLWPFNDEALARAAAASAIPLISAVGHETDTTLIDLAADRRAPTPTAAAEVATPVLADLAMKLAGFELRLTRCGAHAIESRRTRLAGAARGLPRPADLLGHAGQRLDAASARLGAALGRNLHAHAQALAGPARTLSLVLIRRPIELGRRRLADLGARLAPLAGRRIERERERLASLERQRLSLNPEGPLARGYALVRKADGRLVRSAQSLAAFEPVRLKFADGERGAVIDGQPQRRRAGAGADERQGDLF